MAGELSLRRLKRCRQDAAQTDGKELPQPLPQAVSANAFIIAAGPSSTHARAHVAEVSAYYVSGLHPQTVSRSTPYLAGEWMRCHQAKPSGR